MLIIFYLFLNAYFHKYLKISSQKRMLMIHTCFFFMTLLISNPFVLLFYIILMLALSKETMISKIFHCLFLFMALTSCVATRLYLLHLFSPYIMESWIPFLKGTLTILLLLAVKWTIPILMPKHTTKLTYDIFVVMAVMTLVNIIIVYLLALNYDDYSFFNFIILSCASYGCFGYLLHRYYDACEVYEKEAMIHDTYMQQIDQHKEIIDENMLLLNKQLRHDLKNHIITLKILIKQNDSQVDSYIDSLKNRKE